MNRNLFYFNCVLTALIINVIICNGYGLDIEERQLLLDLHNWYRSILTKRTYWNQPIAADMTAMDWDVQLERKAENIGSLCVIVGKESFVDVVNRHAKFGIVIIEKSLNISYSNKEHFKITFNKWMNDSLKNGLPRESNQSSYSIIRQILHSRSELVGCAETSCSDDNITKFVCLYKVRPNLHDELFVQGDACSQCPRHKPFCLDGSLCTSKSQCERRSINSHCRCTIIKDICHTHGTFNSTECKCECRQGYQGMNCEEKCVSTESGVFENCRNSCLLCLKGSQEIDTSTVDRTLWRIPTSVFIKDSVKKRYPQKFDILSLMTELIELLKILKSNVEISPSPSTSSSPSSSSTWRSSISSTPTNTELPICSQIKNFCYHATVSAICKKTCDKCTENKRRMAICKMLKGLGSCQNKDLKKICPVTCGLCQ